MKQLTDITSFDSSIQRFLKEATESPYHTEMYEDGVIKIRVYSDEIKELGYNANGFWLYIDPQDKRIDTYVAQENSDEPWIALGIRYISDSFLRIVRLCIISAGTCNYCHKLVGCINIRPIGKGRKTCQDCYYEAKKHAEYPGWDMR